MVGDGPLPISMRPRIDTHPRIGIERMHEAPSPFAADAAEARELVELGERRRPSAEEAGAIGDAQSAMLGQFGQPLGERIPCHRRGDRLQRLTLERMAPPCRALEAAPLGFTLHAREMFIQLQHDAGADEGERSE